MYNLIWAAKNSRRNFKLILRTVLFVSVVFCALLLLLSFRAGSKIQMEDSIRQAVGDIFVTGLDKEDSLTPLKELLEKDLSFDLQQIYASLFVEDCLFIHDGFYEQGAIEGIEPRFFQVNANHLYWDAGSNFSNQGTQAILEKSFAELLRLEPGDVLTIRYQTKTGVFNTMQFFISGVFIGNKYIHGNTLFTSVENAQFLAMESENINRLRVFLKTPSDRALLYKITKTLEEMTDRISLTVLGLRQGAFQATILFSMLSQIMSVVLALVIISALVILFFALYNTFYLLFRARTAEIATLLTYGMQRKEVIGLYLREAILQLAIGCFAGLGFTFLVKYSLTYLPLVNGLEDLTAILGGPQLSFVVTIRDALLITIFTVVVGLRACRKAIRSYLRQEIKVIMGLGF